MKNITLLTMFTLFFSLQANASGNDYAEAAMEYYKGDPNISHFDIDWNEETEKGVITLRLNWVNYDADMHSTGFDLSSGFRPYLSSPSLPAYCSVKNVEGQIVAPGVSAYSEIKLYIAGDTCPRAFKKFTYESIRLSKYNVPFNNSEEYTMNFQLWVFETP